MSPNATGAERRPIPYGEALELQRRLASLRADGAGPDRLWLLEHPPTITATRTAGAEHLLLAQEEYAARGIAVEMTDRGGDVTFHGPGQLVGYPIVRLGESERDLHAYLRRLEDALIALLAGVGLRGERIAGRTGVWLTPPPRKVAAMGVRARRWVTSHGFALNVSNSLAGFETIVPCGIADASVTSLERELGADALPSWDELCRRAHAACEAALERPLELVIGGAARSLART